MAIVESSLNNGKYLVLTETGQVLPDSEGANVETVNGSSTSHDLGDRKFLIQVTMTEACAGDGALDAKVQGSLDGTNWVDLDATIGMDVDTTGLNTAVGIADLTNFFAPYYRIVVFSDGTDLVDAGVLML